VCSRTVNTITTTFQTSIRSWRMKEVLSHLQLNRSRVGLWHLLEQMKSKRPCTPSHARSNCCVVGDCGCVEPASGSKGSNEIYGWQVAPVTCCFTCPGPPSWHLLDAMLCSNSWAWDALPATAKALMAALKFTTSGRTWQ